MSGYYQIVEYAFQNEAYYKLAHIHNKHLLNTYTYGV